jgi:hypothetical protein
MLRTSAYSECSSSRDRFGIGFVSTMSLDVVGTDGRRRCGSDGGAALRFPRGATTFRCNPLGRCAGAYVRCVPLLGDETEGAAPAAGA